MTFTNEFCLCYIISQQHSGPRDGTKGNNKATSEYNRLNHFIRRKAEKVERETRE